MESACISLTNIIDQMQKNGAQRILVKELANNDNSKQQIYLGKDFKVIQTIPSGEISSAGISRKGPIFKAPLKFYWISPYGHIEQAYGAQLILYPKYPEVRLSGMLNGCNLAPSHLLQPPTPEERAQRLQIHRYMLLGITSNSILAYISAWGDNVSNEAEHLIDSGQIQLCTSLLYEYPIKPSDSREKLIMRLQEIYNHGPIRSCRLNSSGKLMEYAARNGAGYTLEALFGITPNGIAEPDFMDWELKAHSSGPVTMMTPEPDSGTYRESLEEFMRNHGTRIQPERMDFASRHNIGILNTKSRLTLFLEGYDLSKREITDPDGGLILRNSINQPVAGWSFSKLIEHWKKKHANTCFVSYVAHQEDVPYYTFGPRFTLATGTDIGKFLTALHNSTIYYDPGINMKLVNGSWKPKKRNQFRVAWKNIDQLYTETETFTFSN